MPITKMERTLLDCVSWGAPTYLMRQAVDVALRDGFILRRGSCGLLHAEFTANGAKWRRGLTCEERAVADPRHPAWHGGRGRTLAWGGAWPWPACRCGATRLGRRAVHRGPSARRRPCGRFRACLLRPPRLPPLTGEQPPLRKAVILRGAAIGTTSLTCGRAGRGIQVRASKARGLLSGGGRRRFIN